MVQALAFAEIFLGLILADAGYKGVSVSRVVKGEAGAGTPPAGLGGAGHNGGSPESSGSSPGVTEPALRSSGPGVAPSPTVAGKNKAFGPSPLNNPLFETLHAKAVREGVLR